MRLVIARCTVDYVGRLTAHLPEAVRLIMVKEDGTLADIEHFAEFTGDTFYAHMDEEAAKASPIFEGRVAHGYLILAFAAGLVQRERKLGAQPLARARDHLVAKQVQNHGLNKSQLTFTDNNTGDLSLEYNNGLPDPDTQVIINGTAYNFTVSFTVDSDSR